MKNMNDLRIELVSLFSALRAGEVAPEVAMQLNNAAGKIIKSCSVQLAYKELTKSDAPIAFLEG